MSETKLLPCPFCGGAPNQEPENGGLGSFWIICDNVSDGCGCEGPYKHSADDAVAAWNRREAPAIAKALLAERQRVSPNLHLIRTFVTDMTDKNWRDKQDYILQQIDRIQG